MKKWMALLLALCLAMGVNAALAQSAHGTVEDQLAETVKSALEQKAFDYEYDAEEQIFTLAFQLDSALQSADVSIYLYDDMVSVSVDCPLLVKAELFEKAAIFTTLANSELYYAQFRVDRAYNWLSCRSCNVIEDVLPSESEIVTLLSMPIIAMDNYGDGIAAICTLGADPYEAFEACQAAIDAQ